MIPILVLKTENKVIYNQSNLNCKTFFEEFSIVGFEWILINILKSAAFSLQTSENNLKPP